MADTDIRRAGSCEQCSGAYVQTYRHKRFCSEACRKKAEQDRGTSRQALCAGCGSTFKPKRTDRTTYCSRSCAFAHRKAAPPPVRKCACGAVVSDRQRSCAPCRDQKRRDALERGREKYRAGRGDVSCPDCGVPIANDGSYQRRCEVCRDARQRVTMRAGRLARKHRERAATVERFDPLEVLRRDEWRCHICRRRTPESKRGTYADDAPELDHIVPLAKGGDHSRANTACACRRCNIAKSDKVMGQPSLLAWAS